MLDGPATGNGGFIALVDVNAEPCGNGGGDDADADGEDEEPLVKAAATASSKVPVEDEGCCLCLSFRMKSPAVPVDGRDPPAEAESSGDSFVGLVDGDAEFGEEERLSGGISGGAVVAVVVLVPPPPPPPPRKRRTPFMALSLALAFADYARSVLAVVRLRKRIERKGKREIKCDEWRCVCLVIAKGLGDEPRKGRLGMRRRPKMW